MKKILLLVFIVSSAVAQDEFVAQTQLIPATELKIELVPIKAGKFKMGSPASETNRKPDEGPQHEVRIDAFWMAKYETTWDLYSTFLNKDLENLDVKEDENRKKNANAVARPSKPYVEMSFGMGKNGGFPVCNITQFAAMQFCKWLYEKTGVFYRLPTEAEWEYAARGGSETAYCFGNDAAQLGNYGWFFENSDGAYKKVGQKKSNLYGLYDMHGNVAEWTLDQYQPDFYAMPAASLANASLQTERLYAHTVRGGSWDDDADALRSAARRASNPLWKQRDPQIPKSDWWMTDASFLGFRIIRPFQTPSKTAIEAYYKRPPKDI
jgi:formylglycine-generating enzyme